MTHEVNLCCNVSYFSFALQEILVSILFHSELYSKRNPLEICQLKPLYNLSFCECSVNNSEDKLKFLNKLLTAIIFNIIWYQYDSEYIPFSTFMISFHSNNYSLLIIIQGTSHTWVEGILTLETLYNLLSAKSRQPAQSYMLSASQARKELRISYFDLSKYTFISTIKLQMS